MKKHPRMLADAGISPARYAELRAICHQYREMRQAVALMESYGRHRLYDAMESRDPTGERAAMAAAMPEARRISMIQRAAEIAGGRAVARAIIKSVTEGKIYERLRPPCGKQQFYRMRLAFYVELDRRMWESGL